MASGAKSLGFKKEKSETSQHGKDILCYARQGDKKKLGLSLKAGRVDDVNYQAKNGCTPLHYAAVNGHLGCVKMLVEAKALHVPNKSGNSPLQWATKSKQHDIVQFLLSKFDDIDVLATNSFGKGCITDAFANGDVDCLTKLLSHHSVSEERLLGGENERKKLASLQEATHRFCFLPNKNKRNHNHKHDNKQKHPHQHQQQQQQMQEYENPHRKADGVGGSLNAVELFVDIREKAIVETDLNKIAGGAGDLAASDQTGLSIWGASVLLARWMMSGVFDGILKGARVKELGAGCGVSGISIARYLDCKEVVVSDVAEETISNLGHNVKINSKNFGDTKVSVECFDWGMVDTSKTNAQFDVVIGSDLVYDEDVVSCFVNAVKASLRKGGTFLYTTALHRAGRGALASCLVRGGSFKMISVSKAPDHLRANPLMLKTDEECDLILPDLRKTPFQLWHFERT